MFFKLPLEFQPGETWAYDNTGYSDYEWVTDHFENRPILAPFVAFSAERILSTVEDMAKWDAALYSAIDLAGMHVPALKRPEGNTDPDPRLTLKLRDVVAGLCDGKHDPDLFTPPMQIF